VIIVKMEKIVKIAMVSEKVNVKEVQLVEEKRWTVDHLLFGVEADLLLHNIAVDP